MAELHQREHVCLVANASTGIYLSLKAAGISNQLVGIPNNVCVDVPLAVMYSGNRPLFLDIEADTFGLDPRQLSEFSGNVGAVIAVHNYGSPSNIIAIRNWCRDNHVLLLEDAAAAQGASIDGQPVGSFGDISVLSFGRGKIVDVGEGGAVLLSDVRIAQQIDQLEAGLSTASEDAKAQLRAVSQYHTRLYNEHYDADLRAYATQFLKMALSARDGVLRKCNHEWFGAAVHGLQTLEANLRRREERVDRLLHLLRDSIAHGVVVERLRPGSVYWRFNIFLRRARTRVLQALLSRGLKASSWYPSADRFICDQGSATVDTPVSDRIGDEILNIWINDEVGDDYLQEVSSQVLQLSAAEALSSGPS